MAGGGVEGFQFGTPFTGNPARTRKGETEMLKALIKLGVLSWLKKIKEENRH